MAKTKGAKNRYHPGDPEYRRPGPKLAIEKVLPRLSTQDILELKVKALELLSTGECFTVTQVARKIGLPPTRLYQWGRDDRDFRDLLRIALEIKADDLEEELSKHANFIPKMMILKGLRPKYRDSYRTMPEDNKMKELLEELVKLGKGARERQEREAEVEYLPPTLTIQQEESNMEDTNNA